MSLRARAPLFSPYSLLSPRQQCICRHDLRLTRQFHATPRRRDPDTLPNHYETLKLQPSATTAEIKKQFYALSKAHHPDLHPNDPTASSHFVKISEAYHVLGNTDARTRYDHDYHRAHGSSRSHGGPSNVRSGSHSSGQAGGRSPSGLSRRKSPFRGPPPSFYRQGGYGTHGEKRREHAPGGDGGGGSGGGASEAGFGSAGTGSAGVGGGFSPGQQAPGTEGYDNDVPHFDREGHFRTQQDVQSHQSRRRRTVKEEDLDDYPQAAGGYLGPFLIMTGVLGIVFAVPILLLGDGTSSGRRRKHRDGNG